MDNWREITADWQGEGAFLGKNAAGGTVYMGNIEGHAGLSPMELLLASLAGCTGVDVASILEKERQPLKSLKVRARGKRREEYPRVYTEIEVEYLLWGNNLQPKAVERAIELSKEKYCSVSAMLKPAVPVKFSYRILADEVVE